MSDKEEVKSFDFDDIFEGSKKPSLCLDCSYLDDNEKDCVNKVTIDYDDDEDGHHEYTVRKFSTSSASSSRQKVVNEGQERRSSLSKVTDHPPLFCTAVLGCSSTGKTSLCYQFTTSTLINMQEVLKMETELGVEADGWQCRLVL